jgi:hypothetical protein
MNKTKASIIVMSHLSDAQELMNNAGNREAMHDINFAKYLIFHLGGDLTIEIDADAWYNKFLHSRSNKVD